MASLSFVIGIIGNVISLLVFTSPIKTFRQVVKNKSTEEYKSVPYITTLLSTSLWTFYGLLKPGGFLVVTVNGAGAMFQLVYVVLFLIYAPKPKKVETAKLAGILNVGFVGVVIVVTLVGLHGSLRLTFTGVVCCALTIGMYASPLAAMRTVIKSKSVAYMPFLLSFFLFLNAGVWSAYAVLVKDIYIGVPNAVGFVFGSAQLILYAAYKNKRGAEDGSLKLVGERDVEMGGKRRLEKGRSLPKPSVMREYSFHKIVKTLSLNPYDLHTHYHKDVQNGPILYHK